jgi:hypothetical protein
MTEKRLDSATRSAQSPYDRREREALEREVQRYEAALRDVVALASGENEPPLRLVHMQRRAIAALSAGGPPSDLHALSRFHPLHHDPEKRNGRAMWRGAATPRMPDVD